MEAIKERLSEYKYDFFTNLQNYLGSELIFYGSIKRYDYFKESSDIDITVITDNTKSILSKLQNYLNEQGLPIQYLDHLDTSELDISNELQSFINDLEDIITAYRYLGVEASDIRPENMGYSKDGKLKAFDIDDKNIRK